MKTKLENSLFASKIASIIAVASVSITPLAANETDTNCDSGKKCLYKISGDEINTISTFFNKRGVGVRIVDSEEGDLIIEFTKDDLDPQLIQSNKYRLSFESYDEDYNEYDAQYVYPEEIMSDEFALSVKKQTLDDPMSPYMSGRRCPKRPTTDGKVGWGTPLDPMSPYMSGRRCPKRPTTDGKVGWGTPLDPMSPYMSGRRCPKRPTTDGKVGWGALNKSTTMGGF